MTLSDEMAAQVRAKVASGEYTSASEVIREGLLALHAGECTVDSWLHTVALPSCDAFKADP